MTKEAVCITDTPSDFCISSRNIYLQATSPVAPPVTGRSQTKIEKRSGNTLYQELAFHDTEANIAEGDDGADITGKFVVFSLLYNTKIPYILEKKTCTNQAFPY